MTSEHLLLFDGVCGLCNRLVRFVLERDPAGMFAFAPIQSEKGRSIVASLGGNPNALSTFYAVEGFRTSQPRLLEKADAAIFVLRRLGWPWRAAGAARVLPRYFRDALYDVIARHRYALFGRQEVCEMPTAAWRRRFVE